MYGNFLVCVIHLLFLFSLSALVLLYLRNLCQNQHHEAFSMFLLEVLFYFALLFWEAEKYTHTHRAKERCVCGRKIMRERMKQNVFHLLVHSPNGYNEVRSQRHHRWQLFHWAAMLFHVYFLNICFFNPYFLMILWTSWGKYIQYFVSPSQISNFLGFVIGALLVSLNGVMFF